MATMHLMVGLPCAGKTTLARTLEDACSALRLTPDEWQLGLFGQDAEDPAHDARHSRIEARLWEVASRALVLGTNVILDFGFWAREEREDYRACAKQIGARSEVHFLDVPEEELLRRLARRNAQPSFTSHDNDCFQTGPLRISTLVGQFMHILIRFVAWILSVVSAERMPHRAIKTEENRCSRAFLGSKNQMAHSDSNRCHGSD